METTGSRVLPSFFVEMRTMVAEKLLDDSSLAHACRAIDDKTWHAVARRVIDQIHQSLQNAFGTRVLNPAFLTQPMDALVVAQEGRISAGG
jgi:hypothetical protein